MQSKGVKKVKERKGKKEGKKWEKSGSDHGNCLFYRQSTPENALFLSLEGSFFFQKEPSKELETTGTETRTKLMYAKSAQTLHTGMCLAHHPQVPQAGVPAPF